SHLDEQKILPAPTKIINPTAHQSVGWAEKDVAYVRKRHELLSAHHRFADKQYSACHEQIGEWMLLVRQQRRLNQPIAATRVEYGSDVDFRSLTRNMVRHPSSLDNFQLHLSHSVKSLRKSKSGRCRVTVRDEQSGEDKVFKANFVF